MIVPQPGQRKATVALWSVILQFAALTIVSCVALLTGIRPDEIAGLWPIFLSITAGFTGTAAIHNIVQGRVDEYESPATPMPPAQASAVDGSAAQPAGQP